MVQGAAKFIVTLAVFCLVVFLFTPFGVTAPERMVVLISIDGCASYYLDDPMADIPTIRRLAKEGGFAQRMNVSFPSVTWSSHTTLVTGVYPRKHGVIANSVLNRQTRQTLRYIGDAVLTKDEAVKSQTLYDAAHVAGLKTAAVIWPAVRRATTLDWLTPDVGTEDLILQDTTPELNQILGAPIGNPIAIFSKWRWGTAPGPLRDGKYSELAAYLLREKQPSLLLLHLVCPDAYQHEYGPQTPEAYWSLNYVDYRIRTMLEDWQRAGILDRVTMFLAADHGFESITAQICPNVVLQQEGLLRLKGSAIEPGSDAYVLSHGGSASVYLLNEEKKSETQARVIDRLSKVEGVDRILTPEAFHALGLPLPDENPEQGDLMLIPQDHYEFSSKGDGNEVVIHGLHTGTHGHLPTHPRIGALFVAWGSGIRPGSELETVNAVDVAPTIAALLGISMKDTDGQVLRALLK